MKRGHKNSNENREVFPLIENSLKIIFDFFCLESLCSAL